MIKKKFMLVVLMLLILCCTTACGKRRGGTIEEGLPEDVQTIFDNSLNMDNKILTQFNEMEEMINSIPTP